MSKIYTVVIVEDEDRYAQPLREALNKSDILNVIAIINNEADAFEIVKHNAPDILIVDLQLKVGGGLPLLNNLHAATDEFLNMPYILVITSFTSDKIMKAVKRFADFIFKKNEHYTPEDVSKHLEMMSEYFGEENYIEDVDNKKSIPHKDLEAKQKFTRARIEKELKEYCLDSSWIGKDYLAEAIYQVMILPAYEPAVMGNIYETIGELYETEPTNIDSAIRRLLRNTFKETDQKILSELFTIPLARNKKPSNKQFILYTATKIKNNSGLL